MIELQLGRPVRWINPQTGGWETGRIVNDGPAIVARHLGSVSQSNLPANILDYESLQSVPRRSEWEEPVI